MIFIEKTNDKGSRKSCPSADNNAEYILTSAKAHDLHDGYLQRYNREPSARWYNRHFNFTRIK